MYSCVPVFFQEPACSENMPEDVCLHGQITLRVCVFGGKSAVPSG